MKELEWDDTEEHAREEDILIAYALRFDGYHYKSSTSFAPDGVLDQFYRTGTWNITLDEALATFFMLQRYLFKWGGENLNSRGGVWRAFRSLFLLTCDYDVPIQYLMEERYDQWLKEFYPRHRENVSFIRLIHTTLPYDDNAPLRYVPDILLPEE